MQVAFLRNIILIVLELEDTEWSVHRFHRVSVSYVIDCAQAVTSLKQRNAGGDS